MDVSKNKYKEQEPLKTVDTIKDFFNELSPEFRIEVENEIGERLKIYSCSIRLYYKDKLILRSNGKGMTREYALASGFAECYERFSNELTIDGYFYPYNEDRMPSCNVSFEEELKYFPQCDKSFASVRNFILDEAGPPRGIKYKSLDGDEDILIDPRHMLIINGTNGMAAGNTITEALNQGLSELVERYVMTRSYYNDMRFDEIPESLIEDLDKDTYQRIQSIKDKGFEVRFYDASRTSGLPVVMSLWIDKKRGIHAVRFGAFPVINIAIERCITENLQGRKLEDTWDFLKNAPFRGTSRAGLHKLLTEFKDYIPEECFIPETVLSGVNWDVYVSKDSTNEEILDRFKKVFKAKNIKNYYRDTSLTSKIRSVQIHSPFLNKDLTTEFLEQPTASINEITELTNKLKTGDFTRKEALLCAEDKIYFNDDLMQFIPYKFKNTFIREQPLKYIKAVFQFYVAEYTNALENFNELGSDYIAQSYDINLLRVITSYLACGFSKNEILKKAKVWGYEENEITPLFEPGKDFLKKYLNDVIFEETCEKERTTEKEIRVLIDKCREKLS